MPNIPPRLLAIDDEPAIAEFIGDVAEEIGFLVKLTNNFAEFQTAYRAFEPTAIVLDLVMPGVDGVELMRFLAEHRCRAQVLLASGQDAKVLATAQRIGATQGLQMLGVLQKPIMVADLEALLRSAFDRQRSITEQDLREAIESGRIIVHYQPKADLTTGRVSSVAATEALVRWEHPRHGMVMPDEFIPLAESSGSIGPLTDLVLRDAIRHASEWLADGIPLSVAVNLAPQLLTDLTLPDRIGELFKEFDMPPSQLILEITESGVMEDVVRTMEILTRFRLKGFGLSIDDFGTGYSSLVQLHRMPFSELKIDKSFVVELDDNTESQAIVSVIIDLAHKLGLSVCAEGVETQKSMDFLCSLGCDKVQGYIVSKAVPPTELTAFVRHWNRRAA